MTTSLRLLHLHLSPHRHLPDRLTTAARVPPIHEHPHQHQHLHEQQTGSQQTSRPAACHGLTRSLAHLVWPRLSCSLPPSLPPSLAPSLHLHLHTSSPHSRTPQTLAHLRPASTIRALCHPLHKQSSSARVCRARSKDLCCPSPPHLITPQPTTTSPASRCTNNVASHLALGTHRSTPFDLLTLCFLHVTYLQSLSLTDVYPRSALLHLAHPPPTPHHLRSVHILSSLVADTSLDSTTPSPAEDTTQT